MRMVQGSLEPKLEVTLSGRTGPAALSDATSIKVRGELHGAEVFFREAGPSQDDGVVRMPWVAGDTDDAGRLWVDVLVTWPGDRPQWFRPAAVVDIEPLS